MKISFVCVFLMLSAAGMALMFPSLPRTGRTSLFPDSNKPAYSLKRCIQTSPDERNACSGNDARLTTSSRKLKEITRPLTNVKRSIRSVNINDYSPIDPAPSSKASIQPGPIEHGTPLMPFIPKSPPPDPPKGAPFP